MLSMNKTLLYSGASLMFACLLWLYAGTGTSLTYLACYGIEQALSFDNLLMFYVIFKYFRLDEKNQQRALTIGLITSFLLRGLLIFPASIMIAKFSWLNYLFAAFILYSGVMLLRSSDDDEAKEPRKLINFVIRHGLVKVSMFAVCVIVIEITDIMFAFDSIPAAFLITSNPLIIYSANIFAILGLRSLYFNIASLINRFAWLEKGIAGVLIVVGLKGLLWG